MAGDRGLAGNGRRAGLAMGLALALAGCGTSGIGGSGTSDAGIFGTSPLDLFRTSSKATADAPAGAKDAADKPLANVETEIDCPGVMVRNGAATLMIGSKSGEGRPDPLDVRYQGSIIRTARECHVNAGMMTMKVGIEGRIITGPAGGPGTVDVPLRIAVVQEGVDPKPIVSKFGRETVTVTNAIDRVAFTHIDSDITFPLPQPIGKLDSYVVYVGFDPLGEQLEKKKKPAPRRHAPARPKQS